MGLESLGHLTEALREVSTNKIIELTIDSIPEINNFQEYSNMLADGIRDAYYIEKLVLRHVNLDSTAMILSLDQCIT